MNSATMMAPSSTSTNTPAPVASAAKIVSPTAAVRGWRADRAGGDGGLGHQDIRGCGSVDRRGSDAGRIRHLMQPARRQASSASVFQAARTASCTVGGQRDVVQAGRDVVAVLDRPSRRTSSPSALRAGSFGSFGSRMKVAETIGQSCRPAGRSGRRRSSSRRAQSALRGGRGEGVHRRRRRTGRPCCAAASWSGCSASHRRTRHSRCRRACCAPWRRRRHCPWRRCRPAISRWWRRRPSPSTPGSTADR